MSLFPILADPNPPSNLTGLDVSLVAGQMTALDGADSFTMTASTLTANSVSASWADIVDAVVNPPADQDLQSVLNAGNTANGANASISLLGGTDDLVTASLTNATLTLSDAPHSSTLSASEHAFAGTTASATLSESSLAMVDTDVTASLSATSLDMTGDGYNAVLTAGSLAINLVADPTDNVSMSVAELVYSSGTTGSTLNSTDHTFSTTSANAVYSATGAVITINAGTATLNGDSLSMVSGTDTASFAVGSLSMVNATASSTMSEGSISLQDIPNTSIATLAFDSVAVGKDDDYVEMTKDNLVLANATVSMTHTPTSISGGDATLNFSLASPTDANGQNALLTSSKSVRMTCEQNFAFSCGDDVVVYPRSAVITSSAGGSTDQYLSLIVNGVPYRISLLAQPTFPLRTITTINIGGGQNIFVQEPYIQCDYFTVSFIVSGWSGSADSSNFEILSYPTNAYQPDVSYSVKKVFINGNGTYSFSVQNLTPDRYNALQFFQTSANAFTVSSWTVNGTQQIASPNPVPLVCPP